MYVLKSVILVLGSCRIVDVCEDLVDVFCFGEVIGSVWLCGCVLVILVKCFLGCMMG